MRHLTFVFTSILVLGSISNTTAQDEDTFVEQQAIVVSAGEDGEGMTNIMAFEMSDSSGHMILSDSLDSAFGAPMGSSSSKFSMLNNSSVQQDLQLVDEQLDQIKQINEDFGKKIKEQMELLKDENGNFNFQSGAGLGDLIRELKQEQQNQISSILLPEQQKRLEQVSRQMLMKQMGTSKALSGRLAEELGITKEQNKKIRAKAKELKKQLEEKIAELRATAKEELLEELTSKQKEKLKDLLGDEFVQQKDSKRQRFRMLGRGLDNKSGDF